MFDSAIDKRKHIFYNNEHDRYKPAIKQKTYPTMQTVLAHLWLDRPSYTHKFIPKRQESGTAEPPSV